MTNITTFEDRRSNSIISNKLNSEKFTLPKLIEYSNSKNINEPNFAAGYLPAMQYSDPNSISDVFYDSSEKTQGTEYNFESRFNEYRDSISGLAGGGFR